MPPDASQPFVSQRFASEPALSETLAPLRRARATVGIFCDFDGTLAPIVGDPAAATPVAGVRQLLADLARHYGVVAVISGRPVAFLAAQLPDSILLAGLYGLERQRGGKLEIAPEAERWREVASAAAAQGRASLPPEVLVEPKGLSVAFHYRTSPNLEQQVLAVAADIAATTGLVAHGGRKSVELLPPIQSDKGSVVRTWAGGLGSVCYLGDDLGDMTAFRALDELAARGVATVRIAVGSDEAPAELLRAADLVVNGPHAAVELLRGLL